MPEGVENNNSPLVFFATLLKLRDLYLTVADLLNTDKPDERQIMTYVSCYYHAFQGAMQVNNGFEKRFEIVYCPLF